MATQQVVTQVTIAEGCIVCDVCETACPEVFAVEGDVCIVRTEAQSADFTRPRTVAIEQAARQCPVDVIRCETEKIVDGDPAMQALLEASTARGGAKGVEKVISERRKAVLALRSPAAPDAQFARMLAAGRPRTVGPDKKPAKGDEKASRRGAFSFILLGWLAFAAWCGVAAAALNRFMNPNVLEEPDPRIRCGPLDRYAAMAPGSINEDFKPQGIWLYRSEGRLAAISIICTHLGCIPNWLANDRKFKCPCHGSGFTPPGINFEGPAPRPLERFAIRVQDGQIIVDRSRKFLATNSSQTAWEDADAYIEV